MSGGGRRSLVIALLVLLALGSGPGCRASHDRPSGVAEDWLQQVDNQGRPGLREDSERRAAAFGDQALVDQVVHRDFEEGERYFKDFEVGQASEEGDTALVPYRVTHRLQGDGSEEARGTLQLSRQGDSWRVVAVLPPAASLEVPSDGGPRPARARASQWLLAFAVGVALTAVSVVIIDRQPQPGAAS